MNVPSNSDTGSAAGGATAAPRPGNGRLTLLLIAGIPVTVILTATWMWYFVARGELDLVGALGTANAGELVQPPRQATAAGWVDGTGVGFDPASRRSASWTFVVPQRNGRCDAACERRLFETRQIHMALGKDMGRVERMLVTPAGDLSLEVAQLSDERPVPEDFSAYLETEQRGMTVWSTGEAAFAQMFPELGEEPASWYLMDPSGWVMMRYDPSIDYKDVISDLKFLIRNTNG